MTGFDIEIKKWKDKAQAFKNNQEDVQIIEEFASQLWTDIQSYFVFGGKCPFDSQFEVAERDLGFSLCAMGAPSRGGSVDKVTHLAKRVSQLFWEKLDQKHKALVLSTEIDSEIKVNLLYSRTLSLLRKTYRSWLTAERQKKETSLKIKDEFRKVRGANQCLLWETMQTCPISEQVRFPLPMPVEIAAEQNLIPFMNFLLQNTPITEIQRFPHGILYPDKRLDLCKQGIGQEHIQWLMSILKQNSQIKHFLLGNNVVGLTGAQAIANYIEESGEKKCPPMETWYLAGNKMDENCVALMTNSLSKDRDAKSLWLKRNAIGSAKGAQSIGKLLQSNTNLTILDLDNTGLLDDGLKILVENFKVNTKLKHLYLNSNGFSHAAASLIVILLIQLPNLKSIWMEMNEFGDKGATTLAQFFKENKTLKRIALGSNRFTHEGIAILCDALQNHPQLKCLSFGSYKSTADLKVIPNCIGNPGACSIAELLRNTKTLQYLDLRQTLIQEEGLQTLANAFDQNTSLLQLEYAQFEIKTTKELRNQITTRLETNCQKVKGMSHHEFVRSKLRFLKHTKHIVNIDSEYRNKKSKSYTATTT